MPVFAVKKVVLRGNISLVFAILIFYSSMLDWSDPDPTDRFGLVVPMVGTSFITTPV